MILLDGVWYWNRQVFLTQLLNIAGPQLISGLYQSCIFTVYKLFLVFNFYCSLTILRLQLLGVLSQRKGIDTYAWKCLEVEFYNRLRPKRHKTYLHSLQGKFIILISNEQKPYSYIYVFLMSFILFRLIKLCYVLALRIDNYMQQPAQ